MVYVAREVRVTALETISPIYRVVGEKVRDFRKESGLSQEDLAVLVGCSRITVSNLERGRQRIGLELLNAIAVALTVELPSLMPTRSELAGAEAAASGGRGTDELSERDRAVLHALALEIGGLDEVE